MREFGKRIVCIGLACAVAAMFGCESSDDGPSGGSSLAGSWAWSSAIISAPQLAQPVTVTPALLSTVNKTLTLNATASEPDTFTATAVVPDLEDLVPIAASFGITLSPAILALAGTHNITGTWNADTITVTVPQGTFVLPYSIAGDRLTITVPESLTEQVTGNSGISFVMEMTRT